MRRLGLVITATVFSLLAGCAPTPAGIMGPCPTAPTMTAMSGEDMQWLEGTADISNTYGQQLLGFDETAAQACVEDAGLIWRVVARDGEYFAVTLDYSPQRLNAVISDSVVTEITVG